MLNRERDQSDREGREAGCHPAQICWEMLPQSPVRLQLDKRHYGSARVS